ncbi:MAG: type II toxin-antitoxin system RelB/DinJ family antitoxin [Selenomonas massiliensis]|uniref:type II toxin-antitoxin system RelB/DinJ family antitoxin n=1 Tax=Selenomonas massiliensis TaxID=2058293 RepID=UPI000D0FB911|nr:type II toxin-antitoxin system RelB/DinJ family antitoxin [Selenomonas massiliensis]
MAQASVSIRMDADLKRQFDEFCSEIGMTMTTAFCVFAKTAVRERRIPFEISAERSDPFYSPENMARLKASIAQMEATGGTIHEVDLNG